MAYSWRNWFGGLVNTVVGGVSGAVAAALVEWKTGDHIDWHSIGTIVTVMGAWNFFSFLRTHPLPIVVEETETKTQVTPTSVTKTETKTTVTAADPAAGKDQ